MESLEYHRIPHQVQIAWLHASVPPVLLAAEVVKQHTSMPNLEANSFKQEQVKAYWGVEDGVQEVQKHATKLSRLGVTSYDIQSSPKPSDHVHFIGPDSDLPPYNVPPPAPVYGNLPPDLA